MISTIIPICALKDNYIWALLDHQAKQAYVVDPGDAAPVVEALGRLDFQLAGILITHHHWDHTNGIDALLDHTPHIPVIASHRSALTQVTQHVKEGDKLTCAGVQLTAMEIPGHTLDHTAYYNDSIIFTGDTLFSASCGRIFEGTPEMMLASLNKIAALSDHTNIYCGHEYAAAGLGFAKLVEPHNTDIMQRLATLKDCNSPSTLGAEKTYNPFLRSDTVTVHQAAEDHAGKKLNTPLDVFTAIRQWKNTL